MNAIRESDPLVSIVVPAYKVEAYLAECLESILGQTHRNIEVIVVDDGSPDGSGKIADEFARRDGRLRAVHTENRGVSAARNLGVDESRGDYVAFVDSDDRLAPEFIEYMLGIIATTGACFAMSKYCFKSPDEKQVDVDRIETYSPAEAAAQLLYPYIDIGCWNKLFDRKFLIDKGIRFPVNFFMGEGLNFIVTAAQLSNCVGVGSRKVYYYRKDNMDSATTKVGVAKFINALDAIDNIERNIVVDAKELRVALHFHRYLTTFYAFYSIIVTGSERLYSVEYKKWLFLLRQEARKTMEAKVSLRMKARILFYSLSPSLILKSRNLLGRIKRKMRAKAG